MSVMRQHQRYWRQPYGQFFTLQELRAVDHKIHLFGCFAPFDTDIIASNQNNFLFGQAQQQAEVTTDGSGVNRNF